MNDRIQFISQQKKQILLVDFSNCRPDEVEKISRAIPDYVTTQPRGSVHFRHYPKLAELVE